jgi:hypothetical protein
MTDFHAAVQDPQHTFSDPELKAGKVAETPSGLPLALGGTFALTYTVESGPRKLAVRCFHREVPQAQNRYAKISAKLRSLASPYFVNFEFQPTGIRILHSQYPLVKMDWAEGDTLGMYLDRVVSNAAAVATLRQSFATLSGYLESHSIAHGDIQNENVIVANGALRLIDYDGMFVPGLPEGDGTEVGHKHFQHPGRGPRNFGPKMDRFSFIVVDTSLHALQLDPALYRKFREGGQAIIFKANDFADPASSEIFRILHSMPAVREAAKHLAAVCVAPISTVPTLADFKAGRNIPVTTSPAIGAAPKTTPSPAYIGAFAVVDAMDFGAVLRSVGDKIELVGQIVSVKRGTGRRGRGKGLPYVFVNFGPWNKESVKITIWSEGLGNMSNHPTEKWVGKWISVTGLVEPPYEGAHYGRPYRNVGITVVSDNQVIQISEQDAKFRLGRVGQRRKDIGTSQKPKDNTKIVDEIVKRRETWAGPGVGPASPAPVSQRRSNPTNSPASTAPAPGGTPKTKNQEIVRKLQTPASQSQGGAQPPSGPGPGSSLGVFSRVPGWLWIAAGILLLLYLGNRH